MESSFLEKKQAYHNYLEADFVSAIWVVTWRAAGGLESTTEIKERLHYILQRFVAQDVRPRIEVSNV